MKILILIIAIVFSYSAQASWLDNPCFMMGDHDKPCIINLEGHQLVLTNNGVLTVNSIKHHIKLPEHVYIDWYRDAVIHQDVAYLIFDVSDGDYGYAIIVSVSLSSNTLKWQSKIGGFNGSPLLVTNSGVYAGAIGEIAKYNTKTGKAVWMHEGLYERGTQAYNSFKRPEVMNGNIIFTESKVNTAKYKGIREIIVNDVSGEILSK